MRNDEIVLKGRILTMSGGYKAKDLMLKSAVVKEGLSQLTEMTIEFLSKDRKLKMADVVGYPMSLHIETYKEGQKRHFHGTCISVEYLGLSQGFSHFSADVRPWLWFLTRTADCKIFQEKDVTEIIKEVFGEAGYSDFQLKTRGSYEKRKYCVQYRETDFDFLCRLMEEEGIYYYFDHSGSTEKLVILDDAGSHQPMPEKPKLDFFFREEKYRRRDDHVFEWTSAETVTYGKVTLNDYNFETATADQKVTTAIKKGSHSHGTYEVYDYPGRYRKSDRGKSRSRVRMQAEAIRHQRSEGVSNVRTFATGHTFQLNGHPREVENQQYLVTDATHYFQIETDYDDRDQSPNLLGNRLQFSEDNQDTYRCVFGAVPKSEQFRAPLNTQWPEISSMHTALVVGKKGEEIYTDEYGRIKVQFHWDRLGKKNDLSSCWVRTVMPWTGNAWGMMAVPRMGQEVVIQFEEGDPDRPICTGMLYNDTTKPPYELPANQTKSGLKTNSSKGGGGFHELMFEDKKDQELIRFQSEKDYVQIVKNNATITIGLEKKDEGNLTQTVQNHKTETIKMGDHSFTIETGSQTIAIKTDKTEHIEGNSKLTVDGDVTTRIGGNSDCDVDGNVTENVGGNVDERIGGSLIQKVTGKIAISSTTEITFKVGPSSIKIDSSGVTIKGPTINIEGTGMAEMKSPLTTIKATGMLILKGGLTMIN